MNSFYLKKRRYKLGLTSKDIAEKMGWSLAYTKTTISRYETGERYIQPENAVQLAEKVLDIPVKWLTSAPTLADNLSLTWYLAELFTPDPLMLEVYFSKTGDSLSFSPDVSEVIKTWGKLRDNLAAGLIDRFEYDSALYNLVSAVETPAKSVHPRGDKWSSDICRRVRMIVNRDGAFDREIAARLEASGYSVTEFWQDTSIPLNPAGIRKIAACLRVPEPYLADQFFFDTDADLITFLVHIELTGDPARPKLVPDVTPTDVSISVKDNYLKAALKHIKAARLELAEGLIDHIQYAKRIHEII